MVVNSMIMVCSDKQTINQLKSMGLSPYKENENYAEFLTDKNIEKLNFSSDMKSKIIFTNKMTF
jgi:hypothetical protein